MWHLLVNIIDFEVGRSIELFMGGHKFLLLAFCHLLDEVYNAILNV